MYIKKVVKYVLIIVCVLLLLLIINFVRNTVVINKMRDLGSKSISNYSETIITETNLNGEIFSGEVSKNSLVLTDEISLLNKIFNPILVKENCYVVKNKDVLLYVNKDTGLIEKDEVKKMNSSTTYKINQ